MTIRIGDCVIGTRLDRLDGVNMDMDGFTLVGLSLLGNGATLLEGARLGMIDTEGAGDDEGVRDGCNEVVGSDEVDGSLDAFPAPCILYVAAKILAIVGHFPSAV